MRFAEVGGYPALAGAVRENLPHHLRDPPTPRPRKMTASVGDWANASDPRAGDRRCAADQPELNELAQADAGGLGLRASGATIASPSVVLCSAKPTISSVPSADLAERERGADREPFAEVVQADAHRDQQGEDPAGGGADAARDCRRRDSQPPNASSAR